MEEYDDYYKDAPESIKPTIVLETANKIIEIYKGDFTVKQGENSLSVSGEIKFIWFPNRATIFSGRVTNQEVPNIDQLKQVIIIVNGLELGVGHIYNRDINKAEKIYYLKGRCYSAILGDKSLTVNEITFSIPNLRKLLGSLIKTTIENGIQGEDGRIYLEDDKFIITIDKINDFERYNNELKSNGGFIVLYGGKIAKKKGSISLEEFKQVHFALSNFLYFFNGRRTAPLFMKGVHEGETLWTDYTAYNIDQYKSVPSWTQFQWFNDVSHIWKKFLALWKNDSDKDFINILIHWYIEANSNSAFVEGSIILAQTALELIYNWLIIEQKKLIVGNDAENLSASNKIRLILSELKIAPEIPTAYKELFEFAQQLNADSIDAPEVLTKVRNALIHGQEKKRKDLSNMDDQAKYQTLQLALWYIELSILKIIDYGGKYWNRAMQRNEYVPWQEPVEDQE
jgi:hypothetical protein